MPPLELTRNSHYAVAGSDEAHDLFERARECEFTVYELPSGPNALPIRTLIFEGRQDLPKSAVAAYSMEKDTSALANVIYRPGRTAGRLSLFLGKIGLKK